MTEWRVEETIGSVLAGFRKRENLLFLKKIYLSKVIWIFRQELRKQN